MSNHLQQTSADFDVELESNTSNNPTMQSLIEARLSRRQVVLGGAATASALAFSGLASAGPIDNALAGTQTALGNLGALKLNFNPVARSLADLVKVPTGYTASVLYSLGDQLDDALPAWSDAGSETGESYERRAGDHHDGMYFFGLGINDKRDVLANRRGLLCINHENITQIFLHPNGPTVDAAGNRTVADEVVKEMNAHGVSVIEIRRGLLPAAKFALQRNSSFNRRITTFTPMTLSGPAAGDAQLRTQYSPDGLATRGTVNNCANGYTAWGTYLTCEENYAFYFRRSATDNALRSAAEVTSLNRNGITQGAAGNYGWTTVAASDAADTRFSRWNASVIGSDATQDFRNAPNTFGWVVEIDPYDPTSTPKKRTALGRFAHEGCWPAKFVKGRPVVFYMGDDSRGEYIYKFVSKETYDPNVGRLEAGDRYLNDGTLYVARYNADGSGSWMPLVHGQNGLDASNPVYPFASQADVLINARLAADALGATKMDRPEWGAVNPVNGEVYFTLTNNSQRGVGTGPAVDAANPRSYADLKGSATQRGNVNGHIIRNREMGDRPEALSFSWDIYLFGAQSDADPASINLSGLDASNDFSSPDGLWFSRPGNGTAGLLWIQTDDGAYTDQTNCMLLAALPGQLGDGGALTVPASASQPAQASFVGAPASDGKLRRFLVGPKGCEITGMDSTPDGKALFVNIQHPGENTLAANIADPGKFESHWPNGGSSRPRSSTIVITRDNGGVIGVN